MITTRPSPAASLTRRRVALDGRSVALDPRRHAVRPDLADIRLAERVFAPHYAAPVRRVVTCEVALRAERDSAAPIGSLPAGSAFDLLDIVGGDAWGIAPDRAMVGYVDAAALGEPGGEP